MAAAPSPATLPEPNPAPEPNPTMATALLAWAGAQARELPWRATRDPWAVLVSEMMLQQTQVVRVIPRYHAFLDRFPDPRTCAAATPAEVLGLWSGLGYNRRALNLHTAARTVTERHGGRLPDDLDSLMALPGVGPYTARAVLAFAYERPVGVVDTNAARVLARAVAGRSLGRAEVQRLADASVPAGQGWAYNQAVLDLGATVCRVRRPDCDGCPVRHLCAWSITGFAAADPALGTAGASGRQSRFAGSDREGRGRVVAALLAGALSAGDIAGAAGWPDDPARAERVVSGLVADGLAVLDDAGGLRLP
ncbi:MAG: A/G-specific adenine glycosylase [Acidimicrobiaceae bacterium]|nr:A/G-specific adenine glycosylase [Acidimicrobiaceae bacterium]